MSLANEITKLFHSAFLSALGNEDTASVEDRLVGAAKRTKQDLADAAAAALVATRGHVLRDALWLEKGEVEFETFATALTDASMPQSVPSDRVVERSGRSRWLIAACVGALMFTGWSVVGEAIGDLMARVALSASTLEATRMRRASASGNTARVRHMLAELRVVRLGTDGHVYVDVGNGGAPWWLRFVLRGSSRKHGGLLADYSDYLDLWASTLVDARAAVGESLFQQDRLHEAIVVYEELVDVHTRGRVDRDEAEILGYMFALGELYKATGAHERAVVVYERMAQIAPADPRVPHYLGWSIYSLGKPREAIAAYERALSLRPQYPKVKYNLSLALRSIGRDSEADQALAEALAMTIAADRKVMSRDPRITFSLAILFAHRGAYGDAVDYIRRTLLCGSADYLVRVKHEAAFDALRADPVAGPALSTLLSEPWPLVPRFGSMEEGRYKPDSIYYE